MFEIPHQHEDWEFVDGARKYYNCKACFAAEVLERVALVGLPLAPEKGGIYAEPMVSVRYLREEAQKLRCA